MPIDTHAHESQDRHVGASMTSTQIAGKRMPNMHRSRKNKTQSKASKHARHAWASMLRMHTRVRPRQPIGNQASCTPEKYLRAE